VLELRIDGVKDLRRLAEADFKERIFALQKEVLRSIVERVFDEVVDRIHDTPEKWLRMYKESMKIYEIADLPKGEAGFVIASRVSGDWSMVDAETMIVYFDANPRSPDFNVGKVVEEFSPFAVDWIPHLESYGSRIRVRRVRSDEVKEIREKNVREAPSLLARLGEEGIEVLPGPARIAGTVYFDMLFMVMRMELGFGDIRSPHWRPAIRRIGFHLHEMVRSREIQKVVKSVFDPRSESWKRVLRRDLTTIHLREVEGFKEFQTTVKPRTF
jgi:hypothetical protein